MAWLARKLIEQTQVDLRAGIAMFVINYQATVSLKVVSRKRVLLRVTTVSLIVRIYDLR